MYDFIDVTETTEGVSLPSEALKINGEYIEDQIAGYRTLTVEGREALSPEVSTYETGIRDGSTLKGKRYPARIIRITYQLIAATNEEFREAYNKLAAILDVKDAELIFDDEQDKFFTGTPCLIGEVKPGVNSVVGEFEILCADPFKYSVVEYEAAAIEGENSILVDYNGTYKSFPTLRAEFYKEEEASEDGETVTQLTGNGDCGYVAFFNEDEKIIQMGDPDEADVVDGLNKSQTLINTAFDKSTSWGSAAKSQWSVNSGITSASSIVQTGNVGMAVASYVKNTDLGDAKMQKILTATSKGEPDVIYNVASKAVRTGETTVKVDITITAALGKDTSYFLSGYVLKASVYVSGAWHHVTLKKATDKWRGKTGHTKSISVTLSNLSADTAALTNIRFKVTREDAYTAQGTAGQLSETACSNIPVPVYYTKDPNEYYLKCTNYGSGSQYHGASITRTIPADAAGIVGASNFTFYYEQEMSIGSGTNATNEIGSFQVLLVTGSGSNRKILAGVHILKCAAGKKAKLRFYVNGSTKKEVNIDLSYNNKTANGTHKIVKTGNKITFNVCGLSATFQDANIADTVVNEITCTFSQFGTKPVLSYNGLYLVKFTKNNCQTWRDIPNKFGANDVVEADCKTGEIFLNGVSSPAYGALGNDWEDFCLTPGLNQIGFSYSDWVEAAYAPTVKVKYREVFL